MQLSEDDALSLAAIERLLSQALARDLEVDFETVIAVVREEIAPKLEIVRKFLEAALAPNPTAPAANGGAVPRPRSLASQSWLTPAPLALRKPK